VPDRIRRALAQQTHRLVEREIPMHGQDVKLSEPVHYRDLAHDQGVAMPLSR
jgi:hypothetical protein